MTPAPPPAHTQQAATQQAASAPSPASTSSARTLLRLWRNFTPRRRAQGVLVLGFTLLGALAELVSIGSLIPFLAVLTAPEAVFAHPLAQPLVQALGVQQPQQLILPITLAFVAAVLVAALVRIVLFWLGYKYAVMVGVDFAAQIFRRTLHQPYTVHVAGNSSQIIDGILTKVERVTFQVLAPMVQAIVAALIIGLVLAALVWYQPVVAISLFASLGGIYLLIHRLTRGSQLRASARANEAAPARVKAIQEGMGGIRDLLLDGTQATFCRLFEQADLKLQRARIAINVTSAVPRFMVEALGMTAIAVLAYSMAHGSANGLQGVVPLLGALALAAQRMLPLAQNIYYAASQLSGNLHFAREVCDLLEQPMPTQSAAGSGLAMPFERALDLQAVGFTYPSGGKAVLSGVNLRIDKGARVGLVGATGSGKSTLVDIIMGLLPPTQGQMLIDGVPLTDANRSAWQAHIAHVPQAIFLADASVAENIAFGVPRQAIDMQRVHEAAEQAQIAAAISTWPQGYQTLVGERGVRLSGGQRQRIGIARALYKRASVLVFDEATSALDTETEQAVMQSIESLSRSLTVILIAHRTSTLRGCDRVYRVGVGGVAIDD